MSAYGIDFGTTNSVQLEASAERLRTELRRTRLFGVPFASMHVREAEETLTDTLHVVQLAVAGPLLLMIVGFGAAALGLRFRVYSAATVYQWTSSSGIESFDWNT